MTLGERLQHLMDLKKINQVDAAKGCGVDRSRFNLLLHDKVSAPRRDTFQKISSFFGCNIEWLAKETGEVFSKNRLISLGSSNDDDDHDDEYEETEDNKKREGPSFHRKEHYKENNTPKQSHPFGERLRYLLDVKNIKEVDAAKAVGIAGYNFRILLDGNVFRPKPDTLQRISNFFGCDIDWLADGKGDPFPSKNFLSDQKITKNRLVFSTSEPETKTVRMYRELAEMDADTLGEIQTWLNDMERLRPGFTSWFRLEFQNRFPEFDEWKGKVIKKQSNGKDY